MDPLPPLGTYIKYYFLGITLYDIRYCNQIK